MDIQKIIKGFKTSEFLVVVIIITGIDLNSILAVYGSLPESLQLIGKIADGNQFLGSIEALRNQTWQALLMKAILGSAYIWARDRSKARDFELNKIRLSKGQATVDNSRDLE